MRDVLIIMMDLVSFNYLNKKRIVFFENEYCDDFVKYKKKNYIKNEMDLFDFFLKIDVKKFRIRYPFLQLRGEIVQKSPIFYHKAAYIAVFYV